ncbi:MFS transporter [Paenibacillus sediminis]|uniref:MFS family permease n=1 Tax=Paenibacillus sediminis TaxID=664909 RepID=A0ABS4GYD5_9BACL|nr:MFS transporter [Paenibacillus sediminis]MBP1935280.1 MFS family permease [Paenibacillus sediminis]
MNNKIYLYVKALSDLGSRMDMIVLGALIYSATQSVAWLSASLAIGVLGGMLSSLISGVVADRFDRKKIMIVSDILRCGLILVLIFFPQPEMILMVRFLMGFFGSFFEVSYSAEIPLIYGERNLLAINSLISRIGAVCMVFGFLGGGLIQDSLGYEAVLALDSFSFLVSAYVLMKMKWTSSKPSGSVQAEAQGLSSQNHFRKQLDDLKEVKAYLWAQPALLIVFMVYLLDTFGSGSHNLGIPLLAENINPDRQALFYGLIWSVWGAGNVLSTYAMPKIAWFRKNLYNVYLYATPFMSLGFMAIFMTDQLLWVLPAAFITGIFDACSVTTATTIFQQSDNRIRGRVFGVSTFLNRLGFGVGFIVAPLVYKHLSLFQMVASLHTVVILAALAGIILYRVDSRKIRNNEKERTVWTN